MTNYHPGELVLVEFPHTDAAVGKTRPAIVVLDTGDADVVLARVTTQSQSSAFDVVIQDWQHANLLAPSIVRCHKLATIAKGRIQKRLGSVSALDRENLRNVFRRLRDNW